MDVVDAPQRRAGCARVGKVIIEAAGVAISSLTLLLSRLDKRRAATDDFDEVRAGLLELYDQLDRWCSAALATNEAVALWAANGMLVDDADVVRERAVTNVALGVNTRELFDPELTTWASPLAQQPSRHGKAALRRLLTVYAPEVAGALEESAVVRESQLGELFAMLREGTRQDPNAVDKYVRDLSACREKLLGARELLRQYIATNFPLDTGKR